MGNYLLKYTLNLEGKFSVFCGSKNNDGHGLAIARILLGKNEYSKLLIKKVYMVIRECTEKYIYKNYNKKFRVRKIIYSRIKNSCIKYFSKQSQSYGLY